MDDNLTVYADNGDCFQVRDDTEKPGVMVDVFLNKPAPAGMDRIIDEAFPNPCEGDADTWLIVPASVCRKLGEALIHAADKYQSDWQQQEDDE